VASSWYGSLNDGRRGLSTKKNSPSIGEAVSVSYASIRSELDTNAERDDVLFNDAKDFFVEVHAGKFIACHDVYLLGEHELDACSNGEVEDYLIRTIIEFSTENLGSCGKVAKDCANFATDAQECGITQFDIQIIAEVNGDECGVTFPCAALKGVVAVPIEDADVEAELMAEGFRHVGVKVESDASTAHIDEVVFSDGVESFEAEDGLGVLDAVSAWCIRRLIVVEGHGAASHADADTESNSWNDSFHRRS